MRQTELLGLAHGIEFPDSVPLPEGAVAYQGIPGAWSEHAATLIAPDRALNPSDYFEDVFAKVKSGEAAIGVLPIENSRTGAIGEVYDLLRRSGCYIIAQKWVEITQCLLAIPGTRERDIRTVYSHREGLAQCSRYLKKHAWDTEAVGNTAVAARLAAEKGDNRFAAIGSRRAAGAYGLEVLAENIADDPNNKTRFIAIAEAPCYGDDSNTISVSFVARHMSGALAAVLTPLGLMGVNLTRIESRPATGDSYRFFAEIEGNRKDPKIEQALTQAAAQAEYFEILGCY
jgi:chorismate mutase/prephenate dehydratase